MSRFILTFLILAAIGCSSNNEDPATPDSGPTGTDDASAPDQSVALDMSEPGVDAAESFCAVADCAEDTPVCSELVGRCVECASDNDCSMAPRLTCETVGVDGGDPAFECVECVDDSVCAGGTCDLETHTCV